MQYEIPDEFYYRLHHVRPRFKAQVENVLVYVATAINNIGLKDKYQFRDSLNDEIQNYPGNEGLALKTINNWRTEISSLFGLFIEGDEFTIPGLRAKELAEYQDLRAFFKKFLYSFEYPGGHVKDHTIVDVCRHGVFFKPVTYIIQVLDAADSGSYITSEEATHCIFNDLRVTRDHRSPVETWQIIKENRQKNITYDSRGDMTRYAGDILDYMVIANLLKIKGQRYVLNSSEAFNNVFRESHRHFDGYEPFVGNKDVKIEDIRDLRVNWFNYVNESFEHLNFATDITEFLPDEVLSDREMLIVDLSDHVESADQISTAKVGLAGETLVVGLERQKLYEANQEHLIHLVNFIPTQFGVGYDVQSFETDGSELRKYIEVKTTVSSKSVSFNSIHITPNEWRTMISVRDRYYIYRLMLADNIRRMFIIPDVLARIKEGHITVSESSSGYDLQFNNSSGYEEAIK